MGGLAEDVHRNALPIAIGASVLASLLPFGLWADEVFVVFLHEASHGLAAILTGGRLQEFYLYWHPSGMALTQGGFYPLILAAGYMGSCLWGGALLIAARQRGLEKLVCWALALFIGAFTLLYVRNVFGFGAGAVMAGFFGWVALNGAGWQLALLLNFLAIRSILKAFVDLKWLLYYAGDPARAPVTDAKLMSDVYTHGLVPPLVFALGISLASVLALVAFLVVAWRVERRPSDAG